MISVSTAETLIAAQVPLCPVTLGQLTDLPAAVLRQRIRADRPLPPYDRVAMDGIALDWASWQRGQRRFRIEAVQRAGEPQRALQAPDACLEVMTGAVLPQGCDCVVKVEDLQIGQGHAALNPDLELAPYQNVHRAGSDCLAGATLLRQGTGMGPLQWAVAASVGAAQLRIAQPPRIALIATGDELVPVDQRPGPHQIRESNLWMMAAALGQAGFDRLSRHHATDEGESLRRALAQALSQAEVLILSGGVSMGKFDLVPEVLQDLGVRQVLHKIAQRPGKPLWFGTGPQQQLVFGLPGNPVSAAVCLRRYVLPALERMLGKLPRTPWQAVLGSPLHFARPLTWFMPVSVSSAADGRLMALPAETNGSGDFAGLAASDGFLELPAETVQFKQGEVFPLWLWKV